MVSIYADYSSLLVLLSNVVLEVITKKDRASMNHYELPTDLILEAPRCLMGQCGRLRFRSFQINLVLMHNGVH